MEGQNKRMICPWLLTLGIESWKPKAKKLLLTLLQTLGLKFDKGHENFIFLLLIIFLF